MEDKTRLTKLKAYSPVHIFSTWKKCSMPESYSKQSSWNDIVWTSARVQPVVIVREDDKCVQVVSVELVSMFGFVPRHGGIHESVDGDSGPRQRRLLCPVSESEKLITWYTFTGLQLFKQRLLLCSITFDRHFKTWCTCDLMGRVLDRLLRSVGFNIPPGLQMFHDVSSLLLPSNSGYMFSTLSVEDETSRVGWGTSH